MQLSCRIGEDIGQSQTQAKSLLESIDPTRTHAHFSRQRVPSHSCALCMAQVFKVKVSASSFRVSFPSRFFDVVAQHPVLSVHRVFCVHLLLHHPDLQHPQRPWQEVAETAQAHSLAAVGLAEWLTQLQKQVMSPSSPVSPATWTQCTRRSISPTPTTISRTRTTQLWSPPLTQKGAAPRSIQQHQNCSKQRSFNARTSKLLETDGRSCVESTRLPGNWGNFGQRICCNNDFCSLWKGKRDRDTNVMHSLKDRENLQQILERKVDSAVRGEMMAQRKLYEAEDEVEARDWERRNSDIAFQKIDR